MTIKEIQKLLALLPLGTQADFDYKKGVCIYSNYSYNLNHWLVTISLNGQVTAYTQEDWIKQRRHWAFHY